MFSHEEIQYLLYFIPESADYAADATDLDPEDVPEERVNGLKLLLNSGNGDEPLTSARLLASWGYEEGVEKLKYYINNPEETDRVGCMLHRLHSYNDVFKHILMALTSYHCRMIDRGFGEKSKIITYPLIRRIIGLAQAYSFNLDYFLVQIEPGMFDEFLPDLKEMLQSIINKPQVNPWRIHDVIAFFMRTDLEFVDEVLKENGKVLKDFNF